MSEAKDYYDRTYGMSFGMFVSLCQPNNNEWYKDAIEHISNGDAPEWYYTTPAKAIVGSQAVRKLKKELGLC